LSQGTAIESLPIRLRSKRFEVLIAAAVQGRIRGPNDSAEIEESLFVDAVIFEELRVIAKISEKPVKPPKSLFCAVQPARDGPSFERFGLQNGELEFYKRLLRMPSIARPLHANKKQTLKLAFNSALTQMKTGNLSLHDFTSTGRA